MITVLTPTYNRAERLDGLFQSLLAQDNKEFIWLVVDDGSTDDTESKISIFIDKADFKIIYKKKNNGGKHTALNFAYQFIDTDLTFIVDSDDELTSDAISTIEACHSKYSSESDLCGYSFLRKKRESGYLNSGILPENGYRADFVTCRINGNMPGDMAEVWKTKCLKEFPFPEFPDEKFLGEDIIWFKMAEKYEMRFFDKAIYISNYLDDGLTRNRRKHNILSPKGCMVRAEVFLDSKANSKVKVKAMLQYIIYGKFANNKYAQLFDKSKHKFMLALLYPAAYFLYRKWKKTYIGKVQK